MKKNKKTPKYVHVYNQVLKMIKDGIYIKGEKLPSEPEFSELLGVSRVTLRQALLLLKEDGIITVQHGSGNYVSDTNRPTQIGLEVNSDPLHSICTSPLSKPAIEWELRPSTEFEETVFERKSSICIVSKRYYLDTNNSNKAYSLSFILPDIIEEYIGTLSDTNIDFFLNKRCYELSHKTKITISFNTDNKTAILGNLISPSNQFLTIVEKIYDSTGKLLIYTKSYIALEDSEIILNR